MSSPRQPPAGLDGTKKNECPHKVEVGNRQGSQNATGKGIRQKNVPASGSMTLDKLLVFSVHMGRMRDWTR